MTETRLHVEQWNLIEHLCQFHMLDYPSCLRLLDTEKSGDAVAMSYFIRPMVRHGYLLHTGDAVKITAKGRALYPHISPLIATGGGPSSEQRIMQVSRVAALLREHEIPSGPNCKMPYYQYFVPSACWRNINTAILSTARFAGMLVTGCHQLAVYDIGDGRMDWQIRAEHSLFRGQHYATGMIFICHEDKYIEVAKQIIQQTMWARKRLLADSYDYCEKPVKWSRAPIKVKKQYQQVYLTTPNRFGETLRNIENLKAQMKMLRGDATVIHDSTQGDFEHWPVRTFVNPACNLLKFVYLFSWLKTLEKWKKNGETTVFRFVMYLSKYDRPILDLYPKLMAMEEVTWHDC